MILIILVIWILIFIRTVIVWLPKISISGKEYITPIFFKILEADGFLYPPLLSIIQHICWKYFIQVLGLSFIFLYNLFRRCMTSILCSEAVIFPYHYLMLSYSHNNMLRYKPNQWFVFSMYPGAYRSIGKKCKNIHSYLFFWVKRGQMFKSKLSKEWNLSFLILPLLTWCSSVFCFQSILNHFISTLQSHRTLFTPS